MQLELKPAEKKNIKYVHRMRTNNGASKMKEIFYFVNICIKLKTNLQSENETLEFSRQI